MTREMVCLPVQSIHPTERVRKLAKEGAVKAGEKLRKYSIRVDEISNTMALLDGYL